MSKIANKIEGINVNVECIILLFLCLAIPTAISWFIFKFYELPSTHFLRNRFSKREG